MNEATAIQVLFVVIAMTPQGLCTGSVCRLELSSLTLPIPATLPLRTLQLSCHSMERLSLITLSQQDLNARSFSLSIMFPS